MKGLIPDSLAGRTIAVLLLGLTMSHVFSMTIYTADRVEMSVESAGRHFAQQITSVVRIFDGTPAAWHERMLDVMIGPGLGMSVTPEQQYIDRDGETGQAITIRENIGRLLDRSVAGEITVQIVSDLTQIQASIQGATPDTRKVSWISHLFSGADDRLLRASVHLKDGSWLNFSTHVPGKTKLWGTRAVLSITLMAFGVILLSVWVIRKVTNPLRVFTAASERLGKDVDAPPLVVTGPGELRQATRAFNDMQQRLKRLVENRTRMLAAIAHDLRTPITLLRLRTEFVENQSEREKMQATLNDMESMVSSTMAFARDESKAEEQQTVNLSALVSSICDDLADAGHSVMQDVPEGLVFKGKPVALRRALTNLVENAVKYGDVAHVELINTDAWLEISVTDDGSGIPETEMHNVFLPFHRVELSRSRKTGGIGLGLSIAQSIINDHGGEIRLNNREEGGLRATVFLPR